MTEENKRHLEIDIIAHTLKVLRNWKLLCITFVIAGAIGMVVAFNTPKLFTSTVILAPEISAGASVSGNLADLASNFGVDLNGKSSLDAIYPEIYPAVFSSTDFVLSMFDIPVRLKDDSNVRTYKMHLTKDLKMPFWNYPSLWLSEMLKKPDPASKGKNGEVDPYFLSRNDTELAFAISKSIGCLVDKKTSEITISVTDQDPVVAAIIADTLQHRLQNYIIEYRTKKARTDYEYYKALVEDARKKYVKSQELYAEFCDANVDVILMGVNNERDQLENEMQINFNLYNQMMAQMKAAEAKVQERTPAFTVIQNAYTPQKASSRPRIVTLIMFLFLGFVIDFIWMLVLSDKQRDEIYVRFKKLH